MGRRLAKVPLLFDPGTRWSYSIAVDVQALLVETLSGQPFADYVRQHVLEPLGMRETAWRQPESDCRGFAAMYRAKRRHADARHRRGGAHAQLPRQSR